MSNTIEVPAGGQPAAGAQGQSHSLPPPSPGDASSLCLKAADSPERVSGCRESPSNLQLSEDLSKMSFLDTEACFQGFGRAVAQSCMCWPACGRQGMTAGDPPGYLWCR